MANSSSTAMNLIFAITLLVAVSIAHAGLFGIGAGKTTDPVVQCETAYGTQAGDTCFSIMQMFNLQTPDFIGINPNLVCNKLFAGEWICTKGVVQQ